MTENVYWHNHAIDSNERAGLKSQTSTVIWFTGLSASGKSTIACMLDQMLYNEGYHTYMLDGDNVRHGLCGDLGFSDEDRVENIRRVGEVSKLMCDAGLITLAAFISPFRTDRDMVRELLPPGKFIEVFVDAPLDVCRSRDPKGLYAKADKGEIKCFTGIDSPYEAPVDPEVILDTSNQSILGCVYQLMAYLNNTGVLSTEMSFIAKRA